MIKKHTLTIYIDDKLKDAYGNFIYSKNKSIIRLIKDKDSDTLIHELCHFILAMTTKRWYGHGKKFYKLYKTIKSL